MKPFKEKVKEHRGQLGLSQATGRKSWDWIPYHRY